MFNKIKESLDEYSISDIVFIVLLSANFGALLLALVLEIFHHCI